MKHKRSDNRVAELGISRSALRTLDSAEKALDSIGSIGAMAQTTKTLTAGASLGSLMNKTRVEGIANVVVRKAFSPIPSASATVKTNLFKEASLISSGKMSDLASATPKSTILDIPPTVLGAKAGLSAARKATSFLNSWQRTDDFLTFTWKPDRSNVILSGQPNNILFGSYSGFSGLLGAKAVRKARSWQDVISLPKTSWLFGPPRGLNLLGTLDNGLLGGALPAHDAFDTVRRIAGPGLGGVLDLLGRIDFEALREAALIREARRPCTKVGFAALNAYDKLYMGHPWVADEFLLDYLGIEPNYDRREALWTVLRQAFERTTSSPARWLLLEDDRATVYLRSAVYREAARVKRDRERPDRVWWTERDAQKKKRVELPPPTRQPDNILELMMQRSGDPADIVVPPPDDRGRILEMLYIEGSEQDRRVVRMIIAGFDQAAIAHVVGWPEVQRFTRKAQRWRKIKLDPPRGG